MNTLVWTLLCLAASTTCQAAAPADPMAAERQRIDTIARVMPTVVCIYDANQRGGGSGVVIDPQGYGLTNFHVVAGMLKDRRGLGGLSDGQIYDLQVLGIDPTGDVAMFRLTGKERFDFAELGDSDQVRVGDPALAMGNPFLLSQDHTPTVTLGIVTGTHRYQWGQGNALVYSDCIQTDAAINPGNSGGPLFSARGQVIGINGRISIAAGIRGRFNVGLGYAISINQIKRFIPGLRAGLLMRHGTIQATVNRDLIFNDMLEDGPAWRAGIRPGDKLLSFDGRVLHSANEFASVLGTYPADWPVPVTFERRGSARRRNVNLDPLSLGQKVDFEPDPQVNRQAVQRVLARFREAVGLTEAGPAQWCWTSRRLRRDGKSPPDVFEPWRHRADTTLGVSFHTLLDDQGKPVRSVTCNLERAKLLDGDPDFDLSADEALPWIALNAMRRHLFSPAPPSEMTHIGPDHQTAIGKGGQVLGRTLLDQIELELPGNRAVRLAFDTQTGLLFRVTLQDNVAGSYAVIFMNDYKNVGGLKWPKHLNVSTDSSRYLEIRSGFEMPCSE